MRILSMGAIYLHQWVTVEHIRSYTSGSPGFSSSNRYFRNQFQRLRQLHRPYFFFSKSLAEFRPWIKAESWSMQISSGFYDTVFCWAGATNTKPMKDRWRKKRGSPLKAPCASRDARTVCHLLRNSKHLVALNISATCDTHCTNHR